MGAAVGLYAVFYLDTSWPGNYEKSCTDTLNFHFPNTTLEFPVEYEMDTYDTFSQALVWYSKENHLREILFSVRGQSCSSAEDAKADAFRLFHEFLVKKN